MSWSTQEERIAEERTEAEEHDRNAPHRGCTCDVCEEARLAATEGEILDDPEDDNEEPSIVDDPDDDESDA